jgi:hypothetical protein
MRFFEELFGQVSNSDKKTDYARATLEFATSLEINTNKAIGDSKNQRWIYYKQGEYAKAYEDVRKAQSLRQPL